MISSYQLSEHHNFQTILWSGASATVRTIRQTPAMGLAVCLWAYTLLIAVWPDVALLVATVAKVAAYALLIAGAVSVVAFLPVELFVGLGIVGAYAIVSKPKAARPSRCPYCKSSDVDAQRGWAECRDCGKSWSY